MDGEVALESEDAALTCAPELTFRAITGLPRIAAGADLAELLCAALAQSGQVPQTCDVLVVTSKIVAKAEDRFVDLSTVEVSERAKEIAIATGKDPRIVEVVLWDTEVISRQARDVLIVRHHAGHVSANAGLDQSNARPDHADETSGPWVLRLPADADASAASLRARLEKRFGVALAVIVSDSFGRPFRQGTVGMAMGVAGIEPLFDQRGRRDLDGRPLEHTITATADQLCAAADLVCGQASEGRAAVLVRGLRFKPSASSARTLCRARVGDLYL
jgi:coenzyme F420-0:L-glutamate ligase / coenzyme F420-1:gamma-L-glutamate ligase